MQIKKAAGSFAASAITAAMLMASTSASALTLFQPLTLLEDDNLDTLIFDANSNGRLDVGDRLTAILDFIKVVPALGGPGAYDPMEITAISTIEVATKVVEGTGFKFTFKPVASFEATYGAGAMVALYIDPANNLGIFETGCTSVQSCTPATIDGSLWGVLGLYDTDNEWIAKGSDNVAAAAAALPSSKFSTVNFALNAKAGSFASLDFLPLPMPCTAVDPDAPFACAGDGFSQWIGSADVIGGAGLDHSQSLQVRSDTDVVFAPVSVPEPGSLALLGLGLGLAALSLRRRQA